MNVDVLQLMAIAGLPESDLGDDKDGTEDFLDMTRGGIHDRGDLTFDSSRTPWREVPVEELEREAQA